MFPSLKDDPTADIASPGWGAAFGAVPGAIAGTLGGSWLGYFIGKGGKSGETGANIGAGLGALLGAAAGGTLGYQARRVRNDNTEEYMRRYPEGVTRRDMLADAVLQAELGRKAMLATARA